jgi:hypothetical protein
MTSDASLGSLPVVTSKGIGSLTLDGQGKTARARYGAFKRPHHAIGL